MGPWEPLGTPWDPTLGLKNQIFLVFGVLFWVFFGFITTFGDFGTLGTPGNPPGTPPWDKKSDFLGFLNIVFVMCFVLRFWDLGNPWEPPWDPTLG